MIPRRDDPGFFPDPSPPGSPGLMNAGIHPIAHRNWLPAKQVNASFDIGHDIHNILLRFVVEEEEVRATCTGFNSSVWEDSCVEFFFSPVQGANGNSDQDPLFYYNLEFNAIGTVLGGYGKDRHDRSWLQETHLSRIETVPSLGRKPFGIRNELTRWSLHVRIPVSVFCFSGIKRLTGLTGRANFYKCGDRLTHPHYLSWQPVESPTPDFHTPQFFGKIQFE